MNYELKEPWHILGSFALEPWDCVEDTKVVLDRNSGKLYLSVKWKTIDYCELFFLRKSLFKKIEIWK